MHVTFADKKIIVLTKLGYFRLRHFLRLGFYIAKQVYVINFSQSFQAINLKFCTNAFTSILIMCM